MHRSIASVAVALSALVARPALAQHGHAGDLVVGVTGPTAITADSLAVEGDFDEPVSLAPVSGLLNGWTAADPGFGHLEDNEPDELFFTLAPGASVRLQVDAIDPGLGVWESGFGAFADAPGESILLGNHALHTHPTWYAQSSILLPGWTGTLSATFRLIDVGDTGYGNSEPFTMTFTNAVPEPATLGLLAVGLVFVTRPRL